jgi:hypothetical protein
MKVFTMTIAGCERFDGEKPYTYVENARDQFEAVGLALRHHCLNTEEGLDDIKVMGSMSHEGLPADDCGYNWNDERQGNSWACCGLGLDGGCPGTCDHCGFSMCPQALDIYRCDYTSEVPVEVNDKSALNELIKALIHDAAEFRYALPGSFNHAKYQCYGNALGAAVYARMGQQYPALTTFGGSNLHAAYLLLEKFPGYDMATGDGREALYRHLKRMSNAQLSAVLDEVSAVLPVS